MNISPNLQNEASSDDDGLVKVKPKCKKGPPSRSVDAMVKKVFDLYKPPEGNLKYLQENFAPIRIETRPTTNITVTEGNIPSDLNGIMLRNGPDAQFDPEGHYSCMIHGIRFNGGNPPTYVARYTQTSRYLQQLNFKRSEFIKVSL
ncbi:hypothetical protein LIER_42650 [Lithospermum erythrorhizon]|uniref:Uncharacterized protein n=1 Tax=Lithospermum erythrorhizon TaxID=34254 RepID=A0AAV3NPM3_LITER